MRKGRCNFENFIRKASAFFVAVGLAVSVTGCGDAVMDYMKKNNLANSQDYWEKQHEAEETAAQETETSDDASDAAGSSSGNSAGSVGSSGWGSGSKENDSEKDASNTASSESSASESGESDDSDALSSKAETGTSDINESDKGASDKESADETGSDTEAEDSASASTTIDVDKVNKAIDNLITQIEQETGRTNRRKDVEAEDAGNGSDATTYFSDTYQNAQRNTLGLTEVDIPALKASQQGKYAYEHLTEEGKTLYVELLTIIQHRAQDIVVSTLDEEILDVVCTFVLTDHPEIFYMDGYTYTRYTLGGELKKISFTGNYIYSAEEIEARQARIDQYASTCLAGAPMDGDDYAKVKYVYDYLISNTEYDSSAPDNQNICSVFLNGRSVCQGYAKATQYLLNKLGIPTTLVTGKVNGVGHAWNLVFADGEYTYVDTTWGDSSYQKVESGANSQKMPLINYTYLCCTTQDISKTHTISETLPMPACTSMRNNYYVREGEYFTEIDMGAVGALFERRYADGSNNVTIKCSTQEIYSGIINKLINEQQVFGFMDGSNNTVSYTTFDEQYILIIWLY